MLVTPGNNEKRDCLACDWHLFLAATGIKWVPLPNHLSTAIDLVETLDMAGLVLTGGDDIGVFQERDETEIALLNWFGCKKRPVLGVCRGMQMMSHVFGGVLSRVERECHVAKRHKIEFTNGKCREVNSYHNFAPDFSGLTITSPLHVMARCAVDGTIEAIAGENMLGIMWHPEREAMPDEQDLVLFKKHFNCNE